MDKVFITYKGEVTKGEDGTLDIFIPVSSKDVDRSDEVVEPSAFKRTLPKFMKHPILVASHDYGDLENQIGEWTRLKITDNGLEGRPKYYKGEGNPTADWAYNLASKNRAAFSVGFIPLEYEDGDGEKKPRRTYKQVELLEISQCIIPANRSAVMGMMAKSIDPIVKELCEETLKDLPESKGLIEDIQNAPVVDLTGDMVTKPETTDNTIRIPVDEGNHEGHKMRTIQVSEKEGISALYCVNDKKILTYIFEKEKWDMGKAREWVNSHKSINLEHEISQSEILDEIDYLKLMLDEVGASDKVKTSLQGIAEKYLAQGGIVVNFETPIIDTDRLAQTIKEKQDNKWVGDSYFNGTKVEVKEMPMDKMKQMHDMMADCESKAKKSKEMAESMMEKSVIQPTTEAVNTQKINIEPTPEEIEQEIQNLKI